MMAWTDRHCRYLHRLFSPSAVLFTEMVSTGALVHGNQWHQLAHDPAEHPLALQLGGSDPAELAQCAREAATLGFAEINLNVGCPSERVQRGTFGACLMRNPALVARCVTRMREASEVPITVKCRLGVDTNDTDPELDEFIGTVADAGCKRFYVHARKAILGGLTPAQNRSIPPLQPLRVQRLTQRFPDLTFVVNGGITTSTQVHDYLQWADGVMIGRAAYQNPALLAELEHQLHTPDFAVDLDSVLLRYREYVEHHIALGTKLHSMTRHMLTACNGRRGAKRYRQLLSDNKRLARNEAGLIDEALSCVFTHQAA